MLGRARINIDNLNFHVVNGMIVGIESEIGRSEIKGE